VGVGEAIDCVFVLEDGSLWEKEKYDSEHIKIADSGVVKVVAGAGHIVFLKDDGSLWVKGSNSHGQLGDGTIVARDTPVKIVNSEVVDV
jgi:alpha-tubulin suppressor-like RCC1 family protein